VGNNGTGPPYLNREEEGGSIAFLYKQGIPTPTIFGITTSSANEGGGGGKERRGKRGQEGASQEDGIKEEGRAGVKFTWEFRLECMKRRKGGGEYCCTKSFLLADKGETEQEGERGRKKGGGAVWRKGGEEGTTCPTCARAISLTLYCYADYYS